ncbi:MAG: DUF1501 domain-containing protein [Planctomyces sp.]|nr:DUF1501 domain-containing protein [Planctomyces sp.]
MSSLIHRRHALKIGGAGFLGLSSLHYLRASELPVRAKSVIFLYQFGGPSHHDTFDLKPQAPSGVRGEFTGIDTSLPGLQICEHLPETAKVMDKVTLLRSVHHTMKNHNSASYNVLTGHAPPVDDIRLRDSQELFPAYGSVVDRFAPNANGLPTFVAFPHIIRDGSVTPGQHASFLGKQHDPLLVTADPNRRDFSLPELSLPRGISFDRLQQRREMQQLINSQQQALDSTAEAQGMNAYYEKALGMLNSSAVRDAFDISREPREVRDRYGRTTYGQSCLLARRLVEAGVRFINVYFDESIGGQSEKAGGWDTHGFNNTRMYPIIRNRHLPITEHTLPVLLNDLDERGLLDSTLVLWMGEFGRTPKLNDNISRDHWPQCFTVLMAGGGVKRGAVYGASDKNGAFPARDPVSMGDLSATMFALLGLDPETEMRDALNRPFPIADGRVIREVFA